MQYMLLIYQDENSVTRTSVPEMMGAYMAYTKAMQEAGALVSGERLDGSTNATTVRVTGGKSKVLNGPYAESKEQLAGYYIIEAKDLDGALSWASRCPGAQYGAIEVRPVLSM